MRKLFLAFALLGLGTGAAMAQTPQQVDADRDGHDTIASGGDDCDDQDATRYPGNVEVCDRDGKDEDCNVTTPGRRDSDNDGFTDAQCVNWGPPTGPAVRQPARSESSGGQG